MGDGDVDYKKWTDIFAEKVKNVPVFLETFAGLRRPFNYLSDSELLQGVAEDAAQDLARFIAVAKRGKSREALPAIARGDTAAEQTRQKQTLEKSIGYCRTALGMGVRL